MSLPTPCLHFIHSRSGYLDGFRRFLMLLLFLPKAWNGITNTMRTSVHKVLQAHNLWKAQTQEKALWKLRKQFQMVQVTHCISPVCFHLQGANLGGVCKGFSPSLGCFSFLPQVPSHCSWWVHSPWTGFDCKSFISAHLEGTGSLLAGLGLWECCYSR